MDTKIQPWWLSGLEHVSNSSRHSSKPRFNPHLGHIYGQIYMVTFRTRYNNSPAAYAIGLYSVLISKLCDANLSQIWLICQAKLALSS